MEKKNVWHKNIMPLLVDQLNLKKKKKKYGQCTALEEKNNAIQLTCISVYFHDDEHINKTDGHNKMHSKDKEDSQICI